jgi:hypothetical protein
MSPFHHDIEVAIAPTSRSCWRTIAFLAFLTHQEPSEMARLDERLSHRSEAGPNSERTKVNLIALSDPARTRLETPPDDRQKPHLKGPI